MPMSMAWKKIKYEVVGSKHICPSVGFLGVGVSKMGLKLFCDRFVTLNAAMIDEVAWIVVCLCP